MGHIIENTIRKYVYGDSTFARQLDFILKNKCYPCGSGIKDNKLYLLFDIDEYMETMGNFKVRQCEEEEFLKEY